MQASTARVVDLAAVAESDRWWHSCGWRGIAWWAETGLPFEVADVAELGVPEPDRPERWGALFAGAQTARLIEPAGLTLSRRTGRPTRLWRGIPDGVKR